MTVFEQLVVLIKNAENEVTKNFEFLKNKSLEFNTPITITDYDTDLKIAIIAVLTSGYYYKNKHEFVLAETFNAMKTYFDIYHVAIIKKNFYVNIFSSNKSGETWSNDAAMPIYY